MILECLQANYLATCNLKRFLFIFRLQDEGVKVHFNVHFDPAQGRVASSDIFSIIQQENQLAANTTYGGSPILGDLVINSDSIDIQGNCLIK